MNDQPHWHWIAGFVREGDAKYPCVAKPFGLDGLAVATDGRVIVAVPTADAAGLPPPDAKGNLADAVRRHLALPPESVEIDRAALAAWAALPHPAPDCGTCKGAAVVPHECPCPYCTATAQRCEECQEHRLGRILGDVADRDAIARLLAAAPPSARVSAHRDGEGRLRVWAGDWRAVLTAWEDGPAAKSAITFEANP